MPVKIQPTDSQTQSTNLLFVQVIIVHVQVVTGSSVCFFHHACMLNRLVGYILPIMPELFSMLESTNYAKNYASIMWTTLYSTFNIFLRLRIWIVPSCMWFYSLCKDGLTVLSLTLTTSHKAYNYQCWVAHN